MSKASSAYMSKVASLGCLICQRPAEVHHIRTERIKNDFLTVPLCPDHHRGDYSIHANQRQFENIEGSELHLLARTIEALFKVMNK